MLYGEISHKCDHGDQQFGFREGLGVQNAHAAFLAIFERYKHSKKNLYVFAIDMSKAFDKILHSQGIFPLLRSGVDPFICVCLWTWYRKASILVRVEGNVSTRINVRREIKQDSVLSPVIFNNAIRSACRHLPPYLIEPYVDASHLSYADDILLVSDDLQGLQKAVDSVCAALNGIGLQVVTSKTEHIVFGSGSQQFPNAAIQVGPTTVFAASSLKYLGLPFGSSIKAIRTLIINSLKEKLRKSYGLRVRVKGQFDK
ncbi:uncharacterized protein LOC136041414 [Artemia franciscana]|uniref:uncharacterized protein LOC136041414 n=1 Tax=Artemia franciscana TaxID=6661 RepID=UPI0032DA79DF